MKPPGGLEDERPPGGDTAAKVPARRNEALGHSTFDKSVPLIPGCLSRGNRGDRSMRRRASKRSGPGDIRQSKPLPAEAQAGAVKRALATQIEQAMNESRLTKAEVARRMGTSRSQLNRLLDPDTESVTLDALARAAEALGRMVRLELVEASRVPLTDAQALTNLPRVS
jgi:predicted XRE-type DNA-binding protein